MIVCSECLEKEFLNKPTELLDNTCEKCEQFKPCALIPEDRLLKKAVDVEIKKERKPRTKKEPSNVVVHDFTNVNGHLTVHPAEKKETENVMVEEMPLTDVISEELVKHNLTESLLQEMEKNFLQLEIQGVEDKVGYEAVNKARIACKNTRVMTTKVCKAGREPSWLEHQAWIAKENEIVGRIEKVEDNLAAKQKVIDDIKDAEKRAKEIEEQKRLQERSVTLIGYGMQFTGEHYILEDIKISTLQVKQLDEFVFGQLLAPIKAIHAREMAAKEQREAAHKKAIEEALAKEEEVKKREAAIAEREAAILAKEAKAKEEAEARIREEEAQKLKKQSEEAWRIKEQIDQKLKARRSTLFQIGFSQQGTSLIFQDMVIKEQFLIDCEEDKWLETIPKIKTQVASIKEAMEKARVARENKIREDAAAAERKRLEEETQADAIAAKEEEERLKKIADTAPDLTKFNNFCKSIADIVVPAFSTPAYKEFSKVIQADRLQILKTLHSKKPV